MVDNDSCVPHTRGDEPSFNVYFDGVDRVPHTRGDEPGRGSCLTMISECSPHTWR